MTCLLEQATVRFAEPLCKQIWDRGSITFLGAECQSGGESLMPFIPAQADGFDSDSTLPKSQGLHEDTGL